MATAGFPLWSTTAATNATADPAVNWAEGMAPSAVNDSARAGMASLAKWRDDLYGITAGLSTGGSSTAYTVTTNSTYASAAVMSGAIFSIIPHTTSGASPTLAVDGLTARALNVSSGVAVSTGALKSGTPYFVRYVHASTEFIVIGQTFTADLLKTINDLTSDASPDSAADYVATYDASASAAKKVLLSALPASLPRGFIDGCIISNSVTDATNDINISAGRCRDSTNTVDIIVPTITGKQLDANWAAGSAAGMRNSGAGITNTTYHIWAVRTLASSTADIYAHTSATAATVLTALQAETGGASYVYAQLIMSIVRTGGAIIAFTQTGDRVRWSGAQVQSAGTAFDTTQRNYVLTVPLGLTGAAADVTVWANITGSGTSIIIGGTGETLNSPALSGGVPTNATSATTNTSSGTVYANLLVPLDSSGQISVRANGTCTNQGIITFGFIHPRGQNA